MKACRLASLNVYYVLEEPVSAAFYIAMKNKLFEKLETETQLVFDFGGGTLDVAIVEVGYFSLKTIEVDGDNHLGGQDIDHKMMDHLIE